MGKHQEQKEHVEKKESFCICHRFRKRKLGLCIDSKVSDSKGNFKDYAFVKRYFFDSQGELASVRYELTTDYSDYEDYRLDAEKTWYYSGGKIQMIFPVEKYYIEHKEDQLNYSERSAFYVTLGGHVLPGFDENEYSEPFKRHVISESSLCGLTVEDLLRKLKK